MRPRVLLRTHYQADEPRLLLAAAVSCANPRESRHEDQLVECLVKWARGRAKSLSRPGAVYAVGNARAIGLINESYRWTTNGLAFGFLSQVFAPPERILDLTVAEERLYLRQYMLASGALVISFGKWLLRQGSTTDEYVRDQAIIEVLLGQVMDEYLSIATDIRDRTGIRRERDRLRSTEYGAATKRHKRYPLITSLYRLHLVDISDGVFQPDLNGRLAALLQLIPDIQTLERLAKDSDLFTRSLDTILPVDEVETPAPPGLLLRSYDYAMDNGLQACPIEYLSDVFFATIPGGSQAARQMLLEHLHGEFPREVRFHVDRQGKRAFVLLEGAAREELSRLAVPSGPRA